MSEKSYCQKRLDELGATKEQIELKLYFENEHNNTTNSAVFPIFKADSHDNIEILYYDLHRNVVQWFDEPDTSKDYYSKQRDYIRTRYKYPEQHNNQKYNTPKGQGSLPFLPPPIIEKFEKKTKITTLIITEGEFKAFKGCMHGLDVVGIQGIQNFLNKRVNNIHRDILSIISVCQVKNIVLLFDGDCLDFSEKHLNAGTELSQRPKDFFNAILRFKTFFDGTNLQVYFAHVNTTNLKHKPKGLDDLLVSEKGSEKKVIEDLLHLGTAGIYFYRLNLNSYIQKLKAYFNLDKIKNFYDFHADKIGKKEFVFDGSKWQYITDDKGENGELKMIVSKNLSQFIRVGVKYHKKNYVPVARTGLIREDLIEWSKYTILDDFGKKSIQNIAKFDGFVVKPEHINYEQTITTEYNDIKQIFYNQYYELKYLPEKGEFPTIEKFLKHIFHGNSENQYDVGLDYLQILYKMPMQALPILCLVSAERETGKDTFGHLLSAIFDSNVIIMDNDSIQSNFNKLIRGKLIVGINETDLTENRKMTEKLKKWSTDLFGIYESKGENQENLETFTKYLIMSNNETHFLSIDKEETRFWLRQIPKPEKRDPELLAKMRSEIPAFLYFLNNRQIANPKKCRLWLEHSVYETQAERNLKQEQKSQTQKIIESYIREIMIDNQQNTLYYRADDLLAFCPNIDKNVVRIEKCLLNRLQLQFFENNRNKQKRYHIYIEKTSSFDSETKEYDTITRNKRNVIEFPREKFFTDSEIKELFENNVADGAPIDNNLFAPEHCPF